MNLEIKYPLSDSDFIALEALKEKIVGNCEICKGEGFKDAESKDKKNGWLTSEECKCMKKFKRLKEYYKSKIPQRYWKINIDNFFGDKVALKKVSHYIDNLDKAMKNGLGFLFYGTNGNGKTSLSTIILKSAISRGYKTYYGTFQNLLNLIMKSFSDEKSEDDVRLFLMNVDILVIDEIGKEHLKRQAQTGTVFGLTEFEEILRSREGSKKVTIAVSNLKPSQLDAKYGPSIGSLFSGTMKQIEIIGIDKRKTKMKDEWDSLLSGD